MLFEQVLQGWAEEAVKEKIMDTVLNLLDILERIRVRKSAARYPRLGE